MKGNFISRGWNSLPDAGKVVVVGVAAFGTYKFARKQYASYQVRQRLKLYQGSNVNYTQIGPAGPVTSTINLSAKAATIYDAIHNNDPLGWTEDETRIVDTLKSVPKFYIPQLMQTYQQLYSKDLQAEVVAALDSDEWEKISYLFE